MKKYWTLIKEHPIYSKVASGLILTGLLAILNQAFSWNIFSSIIGLFGQNYVVSTWHLVAVGIIPLGILLGIQFLRRKKAITVKKNPEWMSYTQDLIFDVLWQWKYHWKSIESINTDNIIPLCPECKRELKSVDNYDRRYGSSFNLFCFNCKFTKDNISGDLFNFKDLVILEIQGRIRSGEYKERMKKYRGLS